MLCDDVMSSVQKESILRMQSQLEAVGERALRLELSPFVFREPALDLVGCVAEPLRQLLDEALVLVCELEKLCSPTPEDEDEDEDEDEALDTNLFGLEPTAIGVGRLRDQAWRQVAESCFAGAVELRRSRREVVTLRSHDDLLVACESGQRKLRRLIQAIREGAALAAGQPLLPASFARRELESALAVRQRFARLRRSLKPSAQVGAPSVLQSLRYAASGLAAIIGSSDFPEVRAADRMMLLSLQSRVLVWARNGGVSEDGARILKDVETAADLLRGINLRQELREHDSALVLALLDETPLRPVEIVRYVNRLAQLEGYDDQLDSLLWQARASAPSAALLAQIRDLLAAAAPHERSLMRQARDGESST